LLEQQLEHLEATSEHSMQLASTRAMLSKLYGRLGQYAQATYRALEALEIYRRSDLQQEISQTLCHLANIACWRSDPQAARPLYQEAISIAMAIGDEYHATYCRVHLAAALNSLRLYDEASQLLSQAIQVASDPSRFAFWRGLPIAAMHLAETYLGQEKTSDALALGLQAHEQAKRQMDPVVIGMTWRILGEVASRLSPGKSIVVEDDLIEASDCFAASLRLLRQMDGDRHRAYQAQARTLLAWAAHEQSRGNQAQADLLREEARTLLDRPTLLS